MSVPPPSRVSRRIGSRDVRANAMSPGGVVSVGDSGRWSRENTSTRATDSGSSIEAIRESAGAESTSRKSASSRAQPRAPQNRPGAAQLLQMSIVGGVNVDAEAIRTSCPKDVGLTKRERGAAAGHAES